MCSRKWLAMRILVFFSGIVLVAAGCGAPGPSDCGAASLSRFVDKPVVEVAAIETPGPTRVLPSGERRTVSNPDRLTIVPDQSGRVAALYCG